MNLNVYGNLQRTKSPITVLEVPFNANQISMDDKIATVRPVEKPINMKGINFNTTTNNKKDLNYGQYSQKKQ